VTECPAGACGVLRHCGGELDCGTCSSGVCYENRCCEPRVCAAGECGVFPDGCGGAIRCGDQSCCTPRTCGHPSLENRCGSYDDRCGGSISCVCTDANTRCHIGECCAPKTCAELDRCGVGISDGCGFTVSCTCDPGEVCRAGTCCTPLDCSAWVGPGCGSMDDGCGGTVDCGCATGQRCQTGTCCTPTACGAGAAGDPCGSAVSDGCGGTLSCGCMGGLSCYSNQCCAAQSCTAQGLDERCGPATNGCGLSQWCGCGQNLAIRVAQRNACGSSCADTLGELRTCTSAAALEVLDQTGGWDFGGSLSTDLCNANYGFSPNWTQCHNNFQVDAQGFIYLTAGTHCFSITGSTSNACGSLYFVSAPATFPGWDALPASTAATVVTGASPVCFNLAATDYYPIRWHYTQSGILQSFHVNHCPGGTGNCAPLSSSLLRPALP
jgi:hypothetical protein